MGRFFVVEYDPDEPVLICCVCRTHIALLTNFIRHEDFVIPLFFLHTKTNPNNGGVQLIHFSFFFLSFFFVALLARLRGTTLLFHVTLHIILFYYSHYQHIYIYLLFFLLFLVWIYSIRPQLEEMTMMVRILWLVYRSTVSNVPPSWDIHK